MGSYYIALIGAWRINEFRNWLIIVNYGDAALRLNQGLNPFPAEVF
jgi:hypothetical protein